MDNTNPSISGIDTNTKWTTQGFLHFQSGLSRSLTSAAQRPVIYRSSTDLGQLGEGGPLYVRLQRLIRAAVNDNRLVIGAALPSERDLSEAYNLSRVTVRRAID